MKYLRRYLWHRKRKLSRTHSVIGTIWYYTGKLRKRNMKLLRRGYVNFIPFPDGGWRQKNCAECRGDKARQYVAEVSDEQSSENYRKTVQHLKCVRCKKLRPWWHFAKLPLNEAEDLEVANHGGKAW